MESLKCLKFRGLWNWCMSTPRLWIHDESTTKVQQALPKFNCFQLRNRSKITQRPKSQAIIKHQRNNTETASLFSAPWCVGQMNPRDSVKGKLCLGVQHFMVVQHVVRTSRKSPFHPIWPHGVLPCQWPGTWQNVECRWMIFRACHVCSLFQVHLKVGSFSEPFDCTAGSFQDIALKSWPRCMPLTIFPLASLKTTEAALPTALAFNLVNVGRSGKYVDKI